MVTGKRTFHCPNCNALYQVVKVEAGPETINREITCRFCGGPFAGREGKFVIKYFTLRNAARPGNGNGTIAPKEDRPRERTYKKPPRRFLSFKNTPSATNVEDASRRSCSFDVRIPVSRGTRGAHLEKQQRQDTACSCYQVL